MIRTILSAHSRLYPMAAPDSSWLRSALTLAVIGSGCGSQASPAGAVVPQYNRDTGRLTSIEVDRDKDGKFEARAFMDGTRIQRIEIDENADGKPERWEYYSPLATSGSSDAVIVRAEEASDTTGKVARWEYYEAGQITRVDEDVDENGRVDKWEKYRAGRLASVELDLSGSGKPERRLVYQSDGSVTTQAISDATRVAGS
ncbi:MAG: hypothetical protein ACRD2N_08130 [Vicinamibacterales bacterium]